MASISEADRSEKAQKRAGVRMIVSNGPQAHALLPPPKTLRVFCGHPCVPVSTAAVPLDVL